MTVAEKIAATPLQRARALHEAGAEPAAVIRALRGFLRRPGEELSDDDYRFLTVVADLAFTTACHSEAVRLYDLLAARERGGHGVRLRQAHLRILLGKPEQALAMLDEFETRPEYGLNDERLRSLALLALERFEEAAQQLRSVVAKAPEDVIFCRMLVNTLQRAGAVDEIADLEPLLGALPAEDRFELLLRAKLARRDLAGIGRLLTEYVPRLSKRDADALADVIEELARQDKLATATEVLKPLEPSLSPSAKLAAAAAHVHLLRGEWEDAERWLTAADGSTEAEDLLRLRRLQLFCFTLQLESAERVLAEWGGPSALPQMATTVVATLYAALGRWDGVLELLRARVASGLDLRAEFLEVVALAARATRRYDEVLELLAKAPKGRLPAESSELADRLAVEVSVLRVLDLPYGRDGSTKAPPIGQKLYRDRAALYSELFDGGSPVARGRRAPSAGDREGAIVLCADGRYLLGACVAVNSLLAHNPGLTRRRRLLVACSEDAGELAAAAFGEIVSAAGEEIEVVPAAAVLPAGGVEGLRTGWGCFTPGHALSEAAYYRLFAVRHLLESGEPGRVLYLDSDTCPGRRIEEFWKLDLAGQPLAARFELRMPPIEQAARKLGLDVATYFNSGVLLFDLSHAELPNLLDSAIEISIREPEKLTFLDQCALNVAFAGRLTPLEARHNFYVRPRDRVDGRLKPVVRHFLTRWKPWDATYPGENSLPWLRELSSLGGVVSRPHLEQLLGAQYGSAGEARSLLAEQPPV